MLKLGVLMLEMLGFTVLTAADGREAAAELGRHPADTRVVILDLSMPYMCGGETLRAIRALNATVPVIVCSGLTEESMPPAVADAGNVRFLAKPFPMRELQRVVNEAVAA